MEKLYTSALSACCLAFILSCGAAVAPSQTNKDEKTQSAPVTGQACTEDKDCAGEVCNTDDKVCAPTCSEDKDCKDGKVCIDKTTKNYCGTKPKAECEEDVDCDPGKICTDAGTCKTPRCGSGAGADHCPADYVCVQTACVAQTSTAGSCRVAADCNKVTACKTDKCDCVANKCQAKPAVITCTPQNAASVCKADEYCENSKCVSVTTKACTKDEECPLSFYCPLSQVPGTPRACAPGCKATSDCTNGLVCDLNGTHQCVAPSAVVLPSCTGDEDCEPGCVAKVAADSNYVSAKVCDYRLSDALTGHGVCRDRCSQAMYFIGNPFDLGIPYTPGQTCQDKTYKCTAVNKITPPMVAPDKTSACGGGVIGGYSACEL